MVSSYVGENAEFERQYLSGELEVELTPQVSPSMSASNCLYVCVSVCAVVYKHTWNMECMEYLAAYNVAWDSATCTRYSQHCMCHFFNIFL